MSTGNVTVAILSTLNVPLVMPVLDSIDDGALRKDIAEEAVRLSIMENLCGFDGVTVEEGTTTLPHRKGSFQYRADVDFNKLARCIAALQTEYQRVVGIAKDMHEVVAQIQEAGAPVPELLAPLQTLAEGLKSISLGELIAMPLTSALKCRSWKKGEQKIVGFWTTPVPMLAKRSLRIQRREVTYV
ncbi:Hypothetical protein, putative [Bodo saltans]|uniref:Uncharacterized protein n=1 Tax=Bodo saltans TaxID=75058 RepID=A0A0S4IIV6_BODSA|nr:Hypothetical protein, putative [Bodo saltans]|eukprot:CUE73260.1 Hypothetical protein, putative [Bodo saltans]